MRSVAGLLKSLFPLPARSTVRLRLTLLYAGLFVLSGAGLSGITYLLVMTGTFSAHPGSTSNSTSGGIVHAASGGTLSAQANSDLHQFLVGSGVALGIMAVICVGVGWVVAGRVLRPLRTITATTRQISETNLHQRLAIRGPHDELTELSDTIDALLARLEAAFDAQRQFVANASHELRTPVTLARTLIQVALDNPELSLESLCSTCQEVLEAGREQERLIDALLTLARSQRGLEHREAFDLAEVTGEVVQTCITDARTHSVIMESVLDKAKVSGDPQLTARLVTNLVQNAILHNCPGGRVSVVVRTQDGHATLHVTNTGSPIPADQVERLLQPFQRLDGDRLQGGDGFGLGLSIVAAIALAHNADLNLQPGSNGGLDVQVTFPRPA
jgi:signal transduction histidine kinase